MMWWMIAWRNLWRNPRRTTLQLLSISGSLFLAMFITNFAIGTYTEMIESGVRMGNGHLGLYHPDYQENRHVGDTVPADALIPVLEKDPDVEALYPRLVVAGLARSSRDSRGAGALGLDFEREKGSNSLLGPKCVVAGQIPPADMPNGLLMGETLASELGLKVGKKVVYTAQDATGDIVTRLYRVSGLMRTGIREMDAGTVIMHRSSLADLIGKPHSAHELAIILRHQRQIPMALLRVQAIAASHPDVTALTWEQTMPGLASGIKMKLKSQKMIYFFIYLLVTIGTINTLLMSVMERTRELGVMRAIGVSDRRIRQMILMEGFILSLVGLVLGLGTTIAVGLYTSTYGIDLSAKMKDMEVSGITLNPVFHSGWDFSSMALLSLAMVLLTLLASLYPARWALKIRPSDAMRNY